MRDLALDIIAPMRPAFLMSDPSSVALAVGVALWSGYDINLFHLLLVLIGALASQASVNALNIYIDFRSGLDLTTIQTPFSGGLPRLRQRPHAAPLALAAGLGTLALVIGIGIYFITVWGWGLLPLGLLGILLIVAYTPWITHMPAVSLVAPGLGVGVLMVMGSHFCLTGQYTWPAFWASLVNTWLVSEILLLNQFPDMEPDRAHGRRNLVIVVGRKRASVVHSVMLWATYASIVAGWALGHLPVGALLGLLTMPMACQVSRGAYRYADDLERLFPIQAKNINVAMLTPALMAIGIFLSVWLG